jgi:hypothetical protein
MAAKTWIAISALAAMVGCGSAAELEDGSTTDEAPLLQGTLIACNSLNIEKGKIGSGQTVATLAERQLTRRQDVWEKYVEFAPGTSAVCDYPLPANLAPAGIEALTLGINYMGPKKSEMLWSWEVLDRSTGAWVAVGDNAFAKDWRWTATALALPAPAERFARGGTIALRYKAANSHDASDLDQMALYATTGSPVCVPACTGKVCGSNGCGGSCGACTTGFTCDSSGQCVSTCVPSCTGKVCGSNGCGGSCGACTTGFTCDSSGQCVSSCVPSCTGKVCGSDGCGDSCGACITGFTCDSSGQCVAGGQWTPPKNLTWYWQLQGTVSLSRPVAAYDIDGFDNSAATISALHAAGKKVICYFSAGTSEDFRSDYNQFPASVQGRSNGWPGEKWLDIRSSTLRPIMQARMQMCKDKGFDAIEPDNIDGFSNNTGFPLTAQDQITYNQWLAETAHSLGLAAFLKNDVDQLAALEPYYDGALNEQCAQYNECGGYSVFLNANKPVLQAEYGSSTSFCSSANSAGRMAALYNLDLDGKTFTPCW